VDEGDRITPYSPAQLRNGANGAAAAGYGRMPTTGGYVQGPPGTRAVDEYYNPSYDQQQSYPPPPQRQSSTRTFASGYPPSINTSSTQPNNQYLTPEPLPNQSYGHGQHGTSYYSATSHQQYPTSQYPYEGYDSPGPAPSVGPDAYNNAPVGHSENRRPSEYANDPNTYHSHPPGPERSYTLGGNGYGDNVLPPLREQPGGDPSYLPYPGDRHQDSPAPTNANQYSSPGPTTPIRGPRSQPTLSPQQYSDSPPGYEPHY